MRENSTTGLWKKSESGPFSEFKQGKILRQF